MSTRERTFWDDLATDLEDPEFLREYVLESVRIATIDTLINVLDDARASAGLSKAALARAVEIDPAVVRRLFSSKHANPTLGTLSEIATALGMRVTLEPMSPDEREILSDPLMQGQAGDARALAEYVEKSRGETGDFAHI